MLLPWRRRLSASSEAPPRLRADIDIPTRTLDV
jgi:hypothetical protein